MKSKIQTPHFWFKVSKAIHKLFLNEPLGSSKIVTTQFVVIKKT